VEVYGLTETFILTMNPYEGKKKTGSVGVPLQSTRVKIVDLDNGNKEVPTGEEGELIARGPQIMTGYYNMPEETKRTLRTFEKENWIFTGDVARMDEDGYLNIVDRLKDMIMVGGYKVFSREVEEILSEHPAVAFGAVVGVPDPERPGSELVKAIIQPTAEYGDMDLQFDVRSEAGKFYHLWLKRRRGIRYAQPALAVSPSLPASEGSGGILGILILNRVPCPGVELT
jgi:acyl-CoA synthetase (AMP-forming)/AMP-acid ligase II